MTLVIVLSIVGSIVLIFSLSVLYARSSRRCRGSRRKLEDDDPESGARRKDIIVNNVDYYGRIKGLKKKRRLQAEKQRALRQMQLLKTVSKQPTSRLKEEKKRAAKNKGIGNKRSLSDMESRRKPKEEVRSKIRRSDIPKKNKEKKKEDGDRFRAVRAFFCTLCDAYSARKKNSHTDSPTKSQDAPKPAHNTHRLSPSSSSESSYSSTTTSSSDQSSSSESSSSESENEEVKKSTTTQKIEKEIKEMTEPISKPKKPPVKPPPPKYNKKPPPRPPAPKIATKTSQKVGDSSDSPNSEGAMKNRNKALSSGYSSESDWNKRKGRGERRSHDHNKRQVRSADGKAAKQMEIPLKEGDEASGTSGNPYEHYPVALSYRQYQDFENDYRRTTGDYHPQYSIVQLIPIQGAKKSVDKDKNESEIKSKSTENFDDENMESNGQRKQDVVGREVQKSDTINAKGLGGVKYIAISEEEEEDNDKEDSKSKRNRNFRRRYDNPAERDQRRHSPDYNPQRRVAAKKDRRPKERSHKRETLSKRDRKREIEDERIINAYSNSKRQRKGEGNENREKNRERKERKSADHGRRQPTTPRKKKDSPNRAESN